MKTRTAIVASLGLIVAAVIATMMVFFWSQAPSSERAVQDPNTAVIVQSSVPTANFITSYPAPSPIEITGATLTVAVAKLWADPTYQASQQLAQEETAHPAPTVQPVAITREVFDGILLEDGMGAMGFAVTNIWMTKIGESLLWVQAGTYSVDVQPSFPTPSDPKYHPAGGPPTISYGAVKVQESADEWKTFTTYEYITPVPVGGLAIVDVVDGAFYLRTGIGEELIFNLTTRQYENAPETGSIHVLNDGIVETRPENAPVMDGYVPYVEWHLPEVRPSTSVTAYISTRPDDGGYLAIRTDGQSEPVLLRVPAEHSRALRAIRLVGSDSFLLFEGFAYPVVIDLKQLRLLDEPDAISVMVAAKQPFSWP